MCFAFKSTVIFAIIFLTIFSYTECSSKKRDKHIDKKYILASEAYNTAKELFSRSHYLYDQLKKISLSSLNTFLDLVNIMNDEMARELRTAVIKFYKKRFFHDFTNYVVSMQEIVDIVDHCLTDPCEKLTEIRLQFNEVMMNFEDIRNFSIVDKCHNELPDEVATAHCILHQAVLFNETMQVSLMRIVQLKTRQHALDLNTTLYQVQQCFNSFIPKFYEQLLVDAYTDKSGYLKIINASISDLALDKWRGNKKVFTDKWSPLVDLLKDRLQPYQGLQRPLLLTLFAANLSSANIVQTLY